MSFAKNEQYENKSLRRFIKFAFFMLSTGTKLFKNSPNSIYKRPVYLESTSNNFENHLSIFSQIIN